MKDLRHIKRFNESDENLNISDVRNSINEGFFDFLFDKKKTAYFNSPVGKGKAYYSGDDDEYEIKKYIQSQLAESGHAVKLSDIKILNIE